MAAPKLNPYEQQTGPSYSGVGSFPRAHPVRVSDGGVEAEDLGRAASMMRQGAWDLRRAEEEEARAWSTDVMANARLEWTTGYLKRQAEAEPGAPDFTPSLLGDFDKYMEKTIEVAPTNSAKNFIRDRLLDLRQSLGESALQFEAKARIDYRQDKFTSAIDTTAKLMLTDPGQYKVALAEQLAVIDASDMPPIQKSSIRQKAIDDISSAATWSQIQKSPAAFLESIGYGVKTGERTRKTTGELAGATGNTAFDAMPFDKRVRMFETAIGLKAQNEADADKLSKEAAKKAGEDAMKSAWGLLFDGKLTRAYIEQIRPVLSPAEYHSLLAAKKGDGAGAKTDPATFRRMQELVYSDPREAEKFAFNAHKNGLLSNEHLASGLSRARELDRTGGPKTEYERTRGLIVGSLDPGPMVPDPVGRQRLAEALDTFDRWVEDGKGKRTDEEIHKRGREVIDQFKFINLSESALALPSPRSGNIRRNVADQAGMMQDILAAGKKAEADRAAGRISQAEYDAEMGILNRWRKIATAPQPGQGAKK